jgi:hypothetical protein
MRATSASKHRTALGARARAKASGGGNRLDYDDGGKGYDNGKGYDDGGKGYDNGKGYDESGKGYDESGKGYDDSGKGYNRGNDSDDVAPFFAVTRFGVAGPMCCAAHFFRGAQ